MSNPMILEGERQTALAEFEAGPIRARAEVSVTPAGVLAIGALLSGVLLSTAAVVWAARRRR
ncbi:hypothetical protein [Caulobacter segnis]|uniref:hypothetical protein n=1 Tax=Caulobacter segnis TaxID=88688 RepID=UPI00286063A7|nr:hypothetical protein [Caulobacter segnis]MDR6627571.1 hypothetical protein [Caulobacter segnis]